MKKMNITQFYESFLAGWVIDEFNRVLRTDSRVKRAAIPGKGKRLLAKWGSFQVSPVALYSDDWPAIMSEFATKHSLDSPGVEFI